MNAKKIPDPFGFRYVDDLIERDRDADSTADGTRDSNFGTGGKATTSIAGSANGIAVLPDGSYIVVGGGKIARFNADGSLDTTFGTSGVNSTDFGGNATAVAIQSDGKIIVAGDVSGGGATHFEVARFTTSGDLDGTFGSGGIQTISFNSIDNARAVTIQPDGKILVGGYTFDSVHSDYPFAVARLTSSGILDSSFGTSGTNTARVPGADGFGYAQVLQPDGKLVVGGESGGDFALARFNTDGSLDTGTFAGGNGAEASSVAGKVQGLALTVDGKIIAAGGDGNDFILARFNSSGSLDTSFGTSSGSTVTDVGSSTTDGAYAVAIQADGKIVATGISAGDFAVLRYTAGGLLDSTFGTGGKVTTNISGTDQANAVVIGPDGKITVAGYTVSGYWDLARYLVPSGMEQRIYAETDANHNVTSLSDVFGTVKERLVYDPYGKSTVLTSAWVVTSDSLVWQYTSQGGRQDLYTGLIRHGVRDESVSLGRWIEQDPAGYVDGANLYEFARSAPTQFDDPSGLDANSIVVQHTGVTPKVGNLGDDKEKNAYSYKMHLGIVDHTRDGEIIQHVKSRMEIAPVNPLNGSMLNAYINVAVNLLVHNYDMWESWYVVNNTHQAFDKNGQPIANADPAFNDEFYSPAKLMGTTGKLRLETWIRFYPHAQGQWIIKPNDNTRMPQSGNLSSTTLKPTGIDDTPLTTHRLLEYDWCLVGGPNDYRRLRYWDDADGTWAERRGTHVGNVP